MIESVPISPIGYLKSPFKEKFGIPRQPGLITAVNATIEFCTPYDTADAFVGLEQFSHIWISFLFHQNIRSTWKPKVRPPRLGGNDKLGVFATRSSFRPNNIGLSVVELKQILYSDNKAKLEISCPDLVDGTPVLDIKPYIAYSDALPNARSSYASAPPLPKLDVQLQPKALTYLRSIDEKQSKTMKLLIEQTLQLDPRPAYKSDSDEKIYGIRLENMEIKWQVQGKIVQVLEIIHIARCLENP